jgi:hypothetical protein
MAHVKPFFRIQNQSIFYYALLIASFAISLKLFFSSNGLPISFQKDHVDWYLNFSKEVFHPVYSLKGAYFSESMLLPVLANSFGAARSMVAYKIFCSILTISILPALFIFAARFFQNLFQTATFIFLICISYAYLWNFTLGFPDPLTILLLFWVAFEQNPKRICLGVILAALSHFSLALLALLGLLALIISSTSLNRVNRFALIKAIVIGLVLGRTILAAWYLGFDYSPSSRFSWAFEYGLESFVKRYDANISGFWFTPGIRFLVVYSFVLLYFLVNKKWAICLAALFALALTYLGLFFTVDGYRIFAVIICAPYAWLLKEFILSLFQKIQEYLRPT